MAVAFDAVGTQVSDPSGTTVDYASLTIGSGSNRALCAVVMFSTANPTSVTLTWDFGGTAQAMTQITTRSTANGQFVRLYGLIAPTSGNKTLRVAWTNSDECHVNAVSWTGVDQTSVAVAFPNAATATGNSTTASVTVTSAAGNAVMAGHVCGSASGFASVNNTQVLLISGSGAIESGANRAAGGASVVMTGTINATDQWASVGTDILAAGGGAETITVDKWFTPPSELIRRKRGMVPSGTIGIKS